MILSETSLAWCSDYAQFYVLDTYSLSLPEADKFGSEVYAQGFYIAKNGFVVFTEDTSRQIIRVRIEDSPFECKAVEELSGDGWNKTKQFQAEFPSKTFVVSSPSKSGTEVHMPRFVLPSKRVTARVSWLEYGEDEYNIFRPKPDIIQLDMWPS
jgi:hypothetical protein